MGGTVGQILAEKHVGLATALVNVEGNLCAEDCTASGPAAAMTADRFAAEGFEAMQMAVYRAGAGEKALRTYYAGLRLCDPLAYHFNARELVKLSSKGDLAARLAALPLPSFYVAGRPGGASKHSLELLAKAHVRTAIIEPSGHCPFIDQPDAFAEALCQMLGGAAGAGPP
jgi:pimeloyl-ACP methyl ester carboxylesterase